MSKTITAKPITTKLPLIPPRKRIVDIPGQKAVTILQLHTRFLRQCPLLLTEIPFLVFGKILIHHIGLLLDFLLSKYFPQDLLCVLVVLVCCHLLGQEQERVASG